MIEFFQSQRHHFERASASFDLTKQQTHALHVLTREGSRTMRDLAEILACDASNVTGLVDRLEERGLVERHSVPGDRRMRMLAVTPAGAKLYRRLAARIRLAPPAIAALPLEDQRDLRDVLARALERSRKANGSS